jgi:hypothetical protein
MPENIHSGLIAALDQACRAAGFDDYMPRAMVGHFVRQVVPPSLVGDKFLLNQFYQWVRQEYPVPDSVFGRAFKEFASTAAGLGVETVEPENFDPGFGETIRDWLLNALQETEAAPAPATAAFAPAGVAEAPEAAPTAPGSDRPEFFATAPGEDARAAVAEELRRELWPAVYEEVRSELARELRPSVEAEVRETLSTSMRSELERSLGAALREELYPRLREQVAAEIRSAEHARLAGAVRAELDSSVREELRRELWAEVREEVKADLRTVMRPALEGEVRREAGLPAGAEPPPESPPLPEASPPPLRGLGAEGQLEIIRRLRERLTPRIREQLTAELESLVDKLRAAERENQRERQLADRDFCLEKIREFLFPDQPALWERVKAHVEPGRWRAIVLQLDAQDPRIGDKLERSRAIIREALQLKAEIEEELGSAPPRGVGRGKGVEAALAGADRVLDFALENLAEIVADPGPAG